MAESIPPDFPGKTRQGRKETGKEILLLAGLVLLIMAIYSAGIRGPFIFDDSRIANNPQLHITDLSLKNLIRAGFESAPSTRPVAYISFALNYYFGGFNTTGYHLANIVIHGLAAIFLYLLIKTTMGLPPLRSRYTSFSWLPFAAALIWAVHPLQTQSVAYIIQRMNSLSALFYILSLYCYAKARLTDSTGKKTILFFSAALAGVLALGSKETAATLPFFIFLYEWFFFRDLDYDWLKKQAFFVFIIAAGIVMLALLYLGTNPLEYILASYSGRDFTLSQRVLTEFRVVVFYISLLLLPHPGRLNLDHFFTISTGLFSPLSTAISASILLLLFAAALASARRHRLISFCLLWFLGNLVIESSVIGLELIFEHRNYLPSMMLVPALCLLVFSIFRHRWLRIGFLCGVVLLFSFWTFERNGMWSSKIALWGDAVAKSPLKARPHNNFGVALKDSGRYEEAAGCFKQTITLDPRFTEAYNNLGNTYMLLGKPEEAIESYRSALNIEPDNPIVHGNLGTALTNRWQLDEALFHYKEAVRLNPKDLEARMNLASVQRMLQARKLKDRGMGK